MRGGEIFVVTGSGQGHLHPCMQLCNLLSSKNYHTTLIISSNLSSTIPSSFTQNPLHDLAQISPPPRPVPGCDPLTHQSAHDLESHLINRSKITDLPLPLCAIIDFQMGWTKGLFWKFNIPVISLFTFGACAAAMEWGSWKVQAGEIKPGQTRLIPGLPEEMSLTHSDLKRKPFGPPRGGPGGPPKPGDRPPWVPAIEGSIALMFNTCEDLDRSFINYMADQMEMPAWGVGPLLPQEYWKSSGSLIRRENNRQSNLTEEEIIQWLDSKPRGSVLYVSFGSEVGPTANEYPQIASALEESSRPFIWVIQSGSGIDGSEELDKKVGDRGLIINGWAPQLLILSHKSTGGFLSHCGWNSTMEAIGRGVPLLTWPIRGDQYFNAKLVVSYLMVGYSVTDDFSQMVKKDDIVKGIERFMGDKEMKRRAETLGDKFEHGFPASSLAALDAFGDFISQKVV